MARQRTGLSGPSDTGKGGCLLAHTQRFLATPGRSHELASSQCLQQYLSSTSAHRHCKAREEDTVPSAPSLQTTHRLVIPPPLVTLITDKLLHLVGGVLRRVGRCHPLLQRLQPLLLNQGQRWGRGAGQPQRRQQAQQRICGSRWAARGITCTAGWQSGWLHAQQRGS